MVSGRRFELLSIAFSTTRSISGVRLGDGGWLGGMHLAAAVTCSRTARGVGARDTAAAPVSSSSSSAPRL